MILLIIKYFLTPILTAFSFWIFGKRSEKNNQKLNSLNDILETNKREEKRAKTPFAIKLKWLRNYDKS